MSEEITLTPESTPREVRKAWTAALRSGQYKQGRGELTSLIREEFDGPVTEVKHCCLGVLCEVVKDVLKLNIEESEAQRRYNGADAYLPFEVSAYAGLRSDSGKIHGGRELTELNDNGGHTFANIADIIDSEPDGLCVKEPSDG